MDIIVKKFGGSSVDCKEKLEIVCSRIVKSVNEKKQVVVVVSAQGKTTDELVNKAKKYVNNPDKQSMDILLATGEMQTVALITMMLKEKGFDSVGLSGMQAGIITDSNYSNAKIIKIVEENILRHLRNNKIVVVAGFQGTDKLGNTTTLGRGGSDLSAVAIAACVKAKKCEIYTDVDGIYTGNPKIIKRAKLLKNVSYDTMVEAAVSGSKVMHNRAVSLGKKYQIPIEVKNTVNIKKGSIISESSLESYNPQIISSKQDLAKITITGYGFLTEPRYLERIYKIMGEKNISIELISITEQTVSIVIEDKYITEVLNLINDNVILK